jgi:hypothetical protein
MSDQDETMRLAAEIVNKWSGPLNDMRRDLRKLSDDVKGTHAAGVTHAKKQGEAVSGLRREFQRLDEHVKTTSLQTMAAFGVTALSVAAAVAAVKDSVFGFGDSTRQLTFLRRETGLAIDQLRQYEALARRVGAAPGAMSKGIQNFVQHMEDIRQGASDEMRAWMKDADRNTNEFLRSLARMSNPEALSAAIGFLDNIPKPQHKKKWLRMFGLPEDLANLPASELRKQMSEIQKNIGTLGPDAEKSALRFEGAIDRMNDSIDRLKLTVGTELADAFADATIQIREFVDENRSGLIVVLKDVAGGIHTALQDARDLLQVYRELRGSGGPTLNKFLWGREQAPAPFQNLWPNTDKLKQYGVPMWNPFSGGGGGGGGGAEPGFAPGFSPMAYHPGGLRSGGGFQMLGAGAASGSPEEVIAKGTHIGVLQALREFRYEVEGNSAAGGGPGSGMAYASYHPSATAGLPLGTGGAGGADTRPGDGVGGGAVRRVLPSPSHPSAAPSYGPQHFTVGDIRRAVAGTFRGDNGIGPVNPVSGRQPASIRYNNPGAQWPRPGDARFGAIGFGRLADGNLIERFPDPSYGAAANMALFASRYTGMRLGAAGARWTGGHGFGVPGYDSQMIVTREMMNDPSFVIPFMKSIAKREAGRPSPLTDEQWARAFMIFRAGGVNAAGIAGAAPGAGGLHGDALRAHFGVGRRGHHDALKLGKESKLEGGNASIHVRFENPPKGMRSKMEASGFKEIKLSRGRTMVPASRDG